VSNYNFIKNKNIILFDDIITSGITSKTIKNMLLKNGANSVYRLFIAKTDDSSKKYVIR
jgi:predicted amidophosphoribosyltransferase